MYIPLFWAGVLATVSAEIIVFIASIVYVTAKRKKNGKEEKNK